MIGAPTEESKAMVKTITPEDIRDLLGSFAAAIELDQLRVDALPPEKFHPGYTDSMWRMWRRNHLEYVNQLLSTADMIPPAILEKLKWIATNYEPAVVGEVALNLFAEAAGGCCPMEELATAELFFGWLIKGVMDRSEGKPVVGDAAALMMRWVRVTDPLRIAQDPECGYGVPSGFVN
jgi:hypothetical protein